MATEINRIRNYIRRYHDLHVVHVPGYREHWIVGLPHTPRVSRVGGEWTATTKQAQQLIKEALR